jgi:C4-dicarboxylate transporter
LVAAVVQEPVWVAALAEAPVVASVLAVELEPAEGTAVMLAEAGSVMSVEASAVARA